MGESFRDEKSYMTHAGTYDAHRDGVSREKGKHDLGSEIRPFYTNTLTAYVKYRQGGPPCLYVRTRCVYSCKIAVFQAKIHVFPFLATRHPGVRHIRTGVPHIQFSVTK